MAPNIFLGITGASGAIYGKRTAEALLKAGCTIDISISPAGCEVVAHELGLKIDPENPLFDKLIDGDIRHLNVFHYKDLHARAASGGDGVDGVVIVPCSMGRLGKIAGGVSGDLVDRAAEVCLKERRKLVVVPRETPLSVIHLENMTRLAKSGAIVLPAMPGFYRQPQTLEDLVDFLVKNILRQFDLPEETGHVST